VFNVKIKEKHKQPHTE